MGGIILARLFYFYGENFYWSLLLVNGDERECSKHGQLAVVGIHLLDKNLYTYFHAGVADLGHAADQLDDCAVGNRSFKIDTIGRYGNDVQATEAGGCNEGHLVHELHGGAAEEGVVVVGGVGKYGFENYGSRAINTLLECHVHEK